MSRSAPGGAVLLAVAAGGAVGALLRWGLTEALPDPDVPWPTLLVNVSGAFALALLPALAWVRRRPTLVAGLGPGLLGGYTTLSAVSEQTRSLLAEGQGGTAAAYLLGTLVAAVLAVALASRLAARP